MGSNDCEDTERLLHCIESKMDLVQQLFELTCQQMECLEGTDIAELLAILNHKQCVFDQLEELRRELEPLMSVDPDQRVWSSEARRGECRRLVDKCGERMAKILTMEEESIDRLSERRQLVAEQLGSMAISSSIDAAYSSQRGTEPASTLDLSSE
jgi:flagellar biosynthesis/type III secretory pathway chaperone